MSELYIDFTILIKTGYIDVLLALKWRYPLVSGSYIGKMLALRNIVREQKMPRNAVEKMAPLCLVVDAKLSSIS